MVIMIEIVSYCNDFRVAGNGRFPTSPTIPKQFTAHPRYPIIRSTPRQSANPTTITLKTGKV